MLSSNRLAAVLSTVCGFCVMGAAGCVDPKGRLDEFENLTRPADGGATADGSISKVYDVSGTSLLAIKIYFAPSKPVQALSMQTVTINPDGTGKGDFHVHFLDKTTRAQLGDSIDILNVPITKNGDFTLMKDMLVIPSAANPVGIDATIQNIKLIGNIKSVDFMCGVVHGHIVEANQNLEDGEAGGNPTTWGAIRVQNVSSLPDPINSCAGAPGADAG
jgi:hypothetical protein